MNPTRMQIFILFTKYHNVYYILDISYIFAYYVHFVEFCIIELSINYFDFLIIQIILIS